MEAGRIDGEPERPSDTRRRLRMHARREPRAVAGEEYLLVSSGLAHLAHVHRRRVDREDQVRVGPEILNHLDLDVELRQRRVGECRILECLGADADDRARQVGLLPGRQGDAVPAEDDRAIRERCLHEVHRGRADEGCDEEVLRRGIERLRRIDLENPPVAHHGNALAERHGLDLVVRDVDRRRLEPRMQRAELPAHADAQLRVEVRERLVHQERFRLAFDRAPHRDPLSLAAGECRRPAVEQVVQTEQLRHPLDARGDLRLRRLADLEPVAEVLAHRHVGVEGVVLKDHRDVARARRELRDVAAVDADRAPRHLLEPGEHPEQGGLPATGRADEHEKLAALDLEGDVVDGHHVAAEDLGDVLEHDLGHCGGSIPDLCLGRNGIDQFSSTRL